MTKIERLLWVIVVLAVLAACETRLQTIERRSKGEGKRLLHCVGSTGGGTSGDNIEMDCFDVSAESAK